MQTKYTRQSLNQADNTTSSLKKVSDQQRQPENKSKFNFRNTLEIRPDHHLLPESVKPDAKAYTDSSNKKNIEKVDQQTTINIHSPSQVQLPKVECLDLLPKEKFTKSTGDVYFANNAQEKQHVIDNLKANTFTSDVIYISNSEDLGKHGLTQQTWVKNGEIYMDTGLLFLNKPLTIIFDLTIMPPSDIASINNILEQNPSFDKNDKKQLLGDNIHRVILVNNDMQSGKKPSGSDLWHRLGQMEHKIITGPRPGTEIITDEDWLAKITLSAAPENKSIHIIDFAITDDWHALLFGAISLDHEGKFTFADGCLTKIGNNSHLILKNAPWAVPDFTETLATAFRAGEFKANQQKVALPQKITLSKETLTTEQILKLMQEFSSDPSQFKHNESYVCLNKHSIETLKGNFRIDGTKIVQKNLLEALLKNCRQLVITSPLEDRQWLWLDAQIKRLPEGEKLRLFNDLPASSLVSSTSQSSRTEDNSTEPTGLIPDSADTLTYELTASDTWSSLLWQINLTSQKDFTFSRSCTPLMKCLLDGKPVIISGLERNPEVAGCLETLLLTPPYVFIHGHKIALPDADITIIRPKEEANVTSSIIHQAFTGIKEHSQPSPQPSVYSLLRAIFPTFTKSYHSTLPWSPQTFPQLFEQQVAAEQAFDGSPEIKPCHQRRALHVLVAKPHRGDPKLYSYIKAKIEAIYPNSSISKKANRTALQKWLKKNTKPDIEQIRGDFWQLARHCPTTVHDSVSSIKVNDIDDANVIKLAAYVVGAAEASEQRALAIGLKVNPTSGKNKQYYDGNLRSTLRDTLVATKDQLLDGTVISETLTRLESQINLILESRDQDDHDKNKNIRSCLTAVYSNQTLPQGFEYLPQSLLDGQRLWFSRQERRLIHLAHRVKQHPIVFLQGEAGAGKSFMAQTVASRTGHPTYQVLHLGPNSSAGDLFGGTQLMTEKSPGKEDQFTAFRNGPLLTWALSDNPPLLVLDEANLPPEGLLAPLAGLTQSPPVLHYQGRVYPLSDKHRIILTGNPGHYDGRHLDSTLQSCTPTFYYPPLSVEVLTEAVIMPGLPGEWPPERKRQACERLLNLLHHYQKLIPGDLTSPRDSKDVLATVQQILRYHSSQDPISEQQVNALIRRAFMDSLAAAVSPEKQQQLTTLSIGDGHFPEDSGILNGVNQAFDNFLEQLQTNNPDADFIAEPIKKLVYSCWQSLEKNDSGKIAIIAKGAAGCGKDFTINKTIAQWIKIQKDKKHFHHIIANPNQWSSLVDQVREAMTKGHILVISELNLIPSRYLEGLFNDVLTGSAAPGFRLFATINPTSFGGREVMSPALKSRCTRVNMAPLSRDDIKGILSRLPGMPGDRVPKLADSFYQSSTALSAQRSPIQLTLSNLRDVGRALAKQAEPTDYEEAFKQYLPWTFRDLEINLRRFEKNDRTAKRVDEDIDKDTFAKDHSSASSGLETLGQQQPLLTRLGNYICNKIISMVLYILKLPIESTVIDGAVLNFKTTTHNTTQIFSTDQFNPSDYRMKISAIQFWLLVEPINTPIETAENEVTIEDASRPWPDEDELILEPREVLGTVTLSGGHWQALPGLSTWDRLKMITPAEGLDIGRSQKTGQLMIRASKQQSQGKITLDFVVEPDDTLLSTRQLPDHFQDQRHDLLTHDVRLQLEQLIFDPNILLPNCKELQTIASLTSKAEQVKALQTWAFSFGVERNIQGEGMELIINLIKNKQGSCRHRATCFHILCSYFNIPSRIVENDCHAYCEVSPDGQNWYRVELGGAPAAVNRRKQNTPSVKYRKQSVFNFDRPLVAAQKSSSHSSSQHVSINVYSFVVDFLLREDTVDTNTISQQKNAINFVINKYYTRQYETCDKMEMYRYLNYFLRIILSPNFYVYISKDKEWKSIAEKLLDIPESQEIFSASLCHQMYFTTLNANEFSDYISWLCDLCNNHENFKADMIVLWHHLLDNIRDLPHKNRIKPMTSHLEPSIVNRLTADGLQIQPLPTQNDLTSKLMEITNSLPKTKSLNAMISQVTINNKFSTIPEAKSSVISSRLAAGLPAFLNTTTHKTTKPVIFDFCNLVTILSKRIKDRTMNNPAANEQIKQLEIHSCEPAKWFFIGKPGGSIESTLNIIKLFITWLSCHKLDNDHPWYWLYNGLSYNRSICTRCYQIQHQQSQVPFINTNFHAIFNIQSTPERLRADFNEPSAIVLQKPEIMKLLNEFLQLI